MAIRVNRVLRPFGVEVHRTKPDPAATSWSLGAAQVRLSLASTSGTGPVAVCAAPDDRAATIVGDALHRDPPASPVALHELDAYPGGRAGDRSPDGAVAVVRHAGGIPDCFDDLPTAGFRFVHVSLDVYELTRDALAQLHPRLGPGGLLMCEHVDDAARPGVRRAFDEHCAAARVRPILLVTGQALLTRGAR